MVPNLFSLPKLTPEQIDEGWRFADEVIDDNIPEDGELGHGTAGKSQYSNLINYPRDLTDQNPLTLVML